MADVASEVAAADAPAVALPVGARVTLHGLTSASATLLNGALGVVVAAPSAATGRVGILVTSPLRAVAARPEPLALRLECVRACTPAELLRVALEWDAALHAPGEAQDALAEGEAEALLADEPPGEEDEAADPLCRASERVRLAYANLAAAAAAAAGVPASAPLYAGTVPAGRTQVGRLHAEAVELANAAMRQAEALRDNPPPSEELLGAFVFRSTRLQADAFGALGDADALEGRLVQAAMSHEMSVMFMRVVMGDVEGGLDGFRPFNMDSPPVGGHIALAQLYRTTAATVEGMADSDAQRAEMTTKAAEHAAAAVELLSPLRHAGEPPAYHPCVACGVGGPLDLSDAATDAVLLRCGHALHTRCMLGWMRAPPPASGRNTPCPTCAGFLMGTRRTTAGA
jgi:hypothetical protein